MIVSAGLLTAGLLLLAVAITAADWRRGLFVAVPVALLQDPLRKLVPGQPLVYVVLVGVVIAAAALTATTSGVSLMPRRIRGWQRYWAAPFGAFVAILIFQAFNALARFGQPIVPAIGLLTYLAPFVALSLVYQTVLRSSENFISKFLVFYVICVLLVLPTIALQYMGYHSSLLGEVGKGIIIFDQDTVMRAYSGFFRASEIAAWHAGACASLLMILIVSRRMTLGSALGAAVLVIVVIGLGALTGRRKFLVEIIVFVSVYVTFLLYFGRGAARLAFLSGLIGLTGFIAFILFMPDEKKPNRPFDVSYEAYVARTKSGLGDVPDRFARFGLAPISWAYYQYGLLGAGLGVGSQGVQNFVQTSAGAAEGGLGKIWLELGAPGFAIIAWLGWAITRHLWTILNLVSRQSPRLSRLALGLASFLVANLAAFAVATQAYGDIFILLLLGTALGTLLAMPVLAERDLQKRLLNLAPNPAKLLIARAA